MLQYEELFALLYSKGWSLECYDPLEISHQESESFATGMAAQIVVEYLKTNDE